jgi:DNA end-binding protein Ku
MPPRSIWKGAIAFGMVSIPVRLFTATQDKDVSFHLLHQPDHSRIKFARKCAIEDVEVPQDELVRAFEVSKGEYVEITDEDLEQLPLPATHTIELSSFVSAADIDPIYYDTSYYLEPEEIGLKAYALLLKVIEKKRVIGLASIAIRNKESLCALRVQEGGLLLETLHYPDEIRERETSRPDVLVNERELDVAGALIDALAGPFEPSQYHDRYREALLELIANKTAGHQVVAPETAEGEGEPAVPDLMAALRASIDAARNRGNGSGPSAKKARPEKEAPDEEASEQDDAPAKKRQPTRAAKASDSSSSAAKRTKPARRKTAA